MSSASASAGGERPAEWTVDELAGLVGLPVRTLREYQTIGVLPGPRRRGRIGLYGPGHLRRLQLIARLRDRGYSLAGIGDLLGSWSAGNDLGEVLGLEPDQLVHIDEPGAPVSFDQLRAVIPAMVPDHLAALEATGVVERCQPDGFCVPSPSLLQLAIEALGIGLDPGDVIDLLDAIRTAADSAAEQVLHVIGQLPKDNDAPAAAAFLRRGRGLLAHGVGRLTLHRIGKGLGVTDRDGLDTALQQAIGKRIDSR